MKNPGFATPQEAEAAFYSAFERADVEAMMEVWSDDDNIICIHPLGNRLTGRARVRESWEQIFRKGSYLTIHLEEPQYAQGPLLAIHVVYENLTFLNPQNPTSGLIIATNVYQLTDSGWRMVLHHASPSTRGGRSGVIPGDQGTTLH
jgi:ketosteroid isomerase-like protein